MIDRFAATRIRILIVIGLAVAAASVYMRVEEFDVLQYGDPAFVVENPLVMQGFTAAALQELLWASQEGRWSPAAILSLAIDVRWTDSDPGLIHAANLFWHGLNATLLFFALNRLTRRPLRSSVVALVFAVHPLAVESVAWLSGRSTLLAGGLLFAGLWAAPHAESTHPRLRRGLTLAAFVGACTASPLAAGAPLLLRAAEGLRIPAERVQAWRRTDWVVLSAVSAACLIANVLALSAANRLEGFDAYPLLDRTRDAAGFVGLTAVHAVVPVNLAPIYPRFESPLYVTAGLVLVIGALGYGLWRARVQAPTLSAGALWFAAALAPALLMLVAGAEIMSDSPAYLALPGITAGVVFGLPQWLPWKHRDRAGTLAAIAAVLLFAGAASRQVMLWKTDIILFRHAIAVTRSNVLAEEALGNGFRRHGFYAEAIDAYRRGLALDPHSATLSNAIGVAHARQAAWTASVDAFEDAREADAESLRIEASLAAMKTAAERAAARIEGLEQALEASPADVTVVRELGASYASTGNWGRALEYYGRHSEAYGRDFHEVSAEAHAQLGQLDRALDAYDAALALAPENQDLRYERARVLYRMGRDEESREEMRQLTQSKPWNPAAWLYLELVFGR